jgi:GT2 family glycosyltransferase
MPDVSLILVNWNANRFLVNCLRSLINTPTKLAFEVIVVDNGSTDGGPDIVEELFPSVRVIRAGENLGFAKANNIGIRESTGRYICLVNTDIEVLDGCLDGLVAHMEDNPDVGVAGPQLLNADRTVQPSCGRFPSWASLLVDAFAARAMFPKTATDMTSESNYGETQDVPVVYGALFLVRREAMDQVGLLDEDFFFYGEERDWCKRFWDAGWKVRYFPKVQAIHFSAGSSSVAPVRYRMQYVRAQLHYWKKHYGSFGRAYARAILTLHHALRLIGRSAGLVVSSHRPAMKQKVAVSAACLGLLIGLKRGF